MLEFHGGIGFLGESKLIGWFGWVVRRAIGRFFLGQPLRWWMRMSYVFTFLGGHIYEVFVRAGNLYPMEFYLPLQDLLSPQRGRRPPPLCLLLGSFLAYSEYLG